MTLVSSLIKNSALSNLYLRSSLTIHSPNTVLLQSRYPNCERNSSDFRPLISCNAFS